MGQTSKAQLTSLDPSSPLSPVGVNKASLHERKRRQHEERNQVGLRQILHHLRLPVLDISVSPEHHRQERDRLRDREQQVRRHHATQHIIRTGSREQPRSSGVREVVTKAREGETSGEESKSTTRLPNHHNASPDPYSFSLFRAIFWQSRSPQPMYVPTVSIVFNTGLRRLYTLLAARDICQSTTPSGVNRINNK